VLHLDRTEFLKIGFARRAEPAAADLNQCSSFP
jgi:hypothetical protein